MVFKALTEFFRFEAASGILLLIAALLAILIENSMVESLYEAFRDQDRAVSDRQTPVAVDQRRADGDLFLSHRTGGQT